MRQRRRGRRGRPLAKFATQGVRGIDGANPDMPYLTMPLPEYLAEANRQTFIVIQIEQQHALDEVDRIAALEGVDVLFLGPGDFSILSGIPGQFDHDLIRQAAQRIADAARKAGKHWGCPSFSVEHTRQLLDLGARFICYGADFLMVKNGLEQVRRDFTPMGFTFDDRLSGQCGTGG